VNVYMRERETRVLKYKQPPRTSKAFSEIEVRIPMHCQIIVFFKLLSFSETIAVNVVALVICLCP
jgi:hypothetical protein